MSNIFKIFYSNLIQQIKEFPKNSVCIIKYTQNLKKKKNLEVVILTFARTKRGTLQRKNGDSRI